MVERFNIRNSLNNCDILLENEVISDELILITLKNYLNHTMENNEFASAMVLHTGSKCYDAVLFAYAVISCLCYNSTNVEDVFESIKPGDKVLYKDGHKSSRYIYVGMKIHELTHEEVIGLKKDDGNIEWKRSSNKDKLVPYYGESNLTGKLGLRNKHNYLADFYADIINTDVSQVSSVINTSIVLVMKKEYAEFFLNNISLRSKSKPSCVVKVKDLVTSAYYTSADNFIQIGTNMDKSESVLQITSNIDTANKLLKDKSGNQKLGVMIFDEEMIWKSETELPRLIKKRSYTKFCCISLRIDSSVALSLLNNNPDFSAFVCTKDFLLSNSMPAVHNTPYALDLDYQIAIALNKSVDSIVLKCDYDNYKLCTEIRDQLHGLKNSESEIDEIITFVKIAWSLLNILQSAPFELSVMEKMIDEGRLTVQSPLSRIKSLNDIIAKFNITGFSEVDAMKSIVRMLKEIYDNTRKSNPKEKYLRTFISQHPKERIAVIVPKDYYIQILRYSRVTAFANNEDNISFFTSTKFNSRNYYDYVIAVGDIYGKRFDVFECNSAMNFQILLYESECGFFKYRKKEKISRDIDFNARSFIPVESDEEIVIDNDENKSKYMTQEEIRKYLDDEAYWRKVEYNSYEKNALLGYNSGNAVTEAKYFAVFEEGETCFFTKNYQPYVYNCEKKTISDSVPLDMLSEGDTIVFTSTNSATKDIVDDIIKNRISESKYPEYFIENYKLSKVWRDYLIEKKRNNPDRKVREIAREIKALGLEEQESTICNWMNIESHIIGPQKSVVLKIVGKYFGNQDMYENYEKYFNAIKVVKHERQMVLEGIKRSIIQSIGGEEIDKNSEFAYIPEKLQELATILTIRSITETSQQIPASIANRPIE